MSVFRDKERRQDKDRDTDNRAGSRKGDQAEEIKLGEEKR